MRVRRRITLELGTAKTSNMPKPSPTKGKRTTARQPRAKRPVNTGQKATSQGAITTDQEMKAAKLRQVKLKNKQIERGLVDVKRKYAREVASAFAGLVASLRISLEQIPFRVTTDPVLQQEIYNNIREALRQESTNLKRSLGLTDADPS